MRKKPDKIKDLRNVRKWSMLVFIIAVSMYIVYDIEKAGILAIALAVLGLHADIKIQLLRKDGCKRKRGCKNV